MKSGTKIKVPPFKKELGFETSPSRSRLMSKVRGKNTKPEVLLRKNIWSLGYRYRVNYSELPGTPDIAFTKYKIAVFIDGEFWHGYDWQKSKYEIKSNRDYWIPKIERNIQKDREVESALSKLGYTVLRFWSKDIMKEVDKTAEIIKNKISEIQNPI